MSKITFRADDDLVDELEALEISKSEAMREALRSYLGAEERTERAPADGETGAIDDLIRQRVDERLDERLRELDRDRGGAHAREKRPEEVTVTVSLGDDARDDSGRGMSDITRDAERRTSAPVTDATPDDDERLATADDADGQCGQCGEAVADDHVFCPNCGEKTSRRLFCECGDEIRSDWSFCPGCGRRTPAADVLGDTPS
ncbi:double zinc ribbon domain-containing protein [Haloterrigena salinisoli]|uniref:double zinc ribbon domain-containing protein n=1 Tax=Haloterrigena salinisoli TaxID=3132747 RepID=UPI0030CBB116